MYSHYCFPFKFLQKGRVRFRFCSGLDSFEMNNYTGQYGYIFPMHPTYTWGAANQAHSAMQDPHLTYSYDSTKQQPLPYAEYMGPQVQDYEPPVKDFNGQYGYHTNSTPMQSASTSQWSLNQMRTLHWIQVTGVILGMQVFHDINLLHHRYLIKIGSRNCEYTANIVKHIRNFKRSFNSNEDKRVKAKSRSDYRRNINRNRKPNFHCEDCKRSFQKKDQYLDHITTEGHMKKPDRNKNDSDDGESRKASRRTDYCDVCEQAFQNSRHFYAHLKWKKHKRLCRVTRLLRGQLKKTPEEIASDPVGSFTLYMNKDCSVPYGNYGDCKEVELDAGNAFLQKFLDLKHLIAQEPNPVGEEFIQEQVYNTRDLEYTCSLCKLDLIGAIDIENHLRSQNHQKKYKEKFNLEQFAFEEEMKLSASDAVFAVWKTCQSRASKELARIISDKGFHLCICGFRITCYDDMRRHFPIKYYDIHPRIRSWKKSLEKCIRSRADRRRIDYRDCYTILTLFGLPSHIIDMKREQALEAAKAKLLEEPSKEDSTEGGQKDDEEDDEEENDDEEEEEETNPSKTIDKSTKESAPNIESLNEQQLESS
ncbi:unnamed protein product [Heterobilharzia americana]|nr:unnamed protein product [Heterobilharzia americana]